MSVCLSRTKKGYIFLCFFRLVSALKQIKETYVVRRLPKWWPSFSDREERERKERIEGGKREKENNLYIYMYIRMLKCFHTHTHTHKYAYNWRSNSFVILKDCIVSLKQLITAIQLFYACKERKESVNHCHKVFLWICGYIRLCIHICCMINEIELVQR